MAAAAVLAGCGALPAPPRLPPPLPSPLPPPAGAGAPASAATASGSGSGSPATGSSVAGFDVAERAAVRVRNVACAGVETGSGFAVDAHTLVTNRHVVEGARTLQVDTYDGHELRVTTAGTSRVADLAVVRTVEALPAQLPLAGADPAAGAPVRVVGYPRGGPQTTARGAVLGRAPDPLAQGSAADVLALSVAVAPGSSGSPVLDGAGEVVGVVYAGATSGQRAYAVPASTLAEALAAATGGNSGDTVGACR